MSGSNTAIVVLAGSYTENLPTPSYFLGVTILFDRDVAERSGCGGADDSRRADCCDPLASQWQRARTALPGGAGCVISRRCLRG